MSRGALRVDQSPTLVGDINSDGLVDIRDYGLWRQASGATDCGNPADLPVQQPMTFDFAVNIKTAQALGIAFPNEIMLQVTEIIQ